MNTHSVGTELNIERVLTERYKQCQADYPSCFYQHDVQSPVSDLTTPLDAVKDGWYIRTNGGDEFLGLGIAKQWKLPNVSALRSFDRERLNLIEMGLRPNTLIAGGWSFSSSPSPDHLWDAFSFSHWTVPALFIRKTANGYSAQLTLFIDRHQSLNEILDYYAGIFDSVMHPVSTCSPKVLGSQSYPSAQEWTKRVDDAISALRSGHLSKLVLARRVDATFATSPNLGNILKRLQHHNPSTTIFAIKSQGHTFLGATPERLIAVHNHHLRTMALAGTMPRGKTAEDDRAQITDLLSSEKDQREHATVVKRITDTLSPYANLTMPKRPQVLTLSNVHHLWTPIEGQLRENASLLSLATLLHPTPAVGGEPREAAIEWLQKYEGLNRGWYAGGVGFMDLQGNGSIWVALRSALIRDRTAHCYAGCGIMQDSIAERELAESEWKLQAMLNALGVND
ncbi:isochorismate synthase [Sulfobacillus thermosulfidooxidans DSM 9293]|uniref:isochorismate synthase n=1 Tax=Sulfobacillus thermosulfidooxidans (strain DSM 9293 / VKM B-1269 / AT-1) TaxID=929705 RepID=A0A1W1W679_SULTA|nr:isochorismate synthase [Sulfobacillus thermosulfidooxidans]SMC01776.1 isochorismate synthase [Sulfobacillus thermosulfidooxidans DSM 9293]